MRKKGLKTVLWLSVLIIILSGCRSVPEPQPVNPQHAYHEVQAVIEKAKKHFEIVQTLHLQERDPEAFKQVKSALVSAEAFFQTEETDEAYRLARQSLDASERLLHQFYQQTLTELARETKGQIEEIAENDPENPLQDFIPELNAVLDYSEELKNGQSAINPQKFLDDFARLKQIEYNTNTNLQKVLEADTYFAPGQYELSDDGKSALLRWNQEILTNIERFVALSDESPIFVKFKVAGYTDEVDFRQGTQLIQELLRGIDTDIPQAQPARRQFLNQRLSDFRARSISAYLLQSLKTSSQIPADLEIRQEVVGLGEILPPEISAPYPTSDARRRICKIYAYIMMQ